MVVEIIIGCEKKVLTNTEIVVIIIAKLIMSTCLLVVLFYYKRRTILKLSSTLLFEQYEANHLNEVLQGCKSVSEQNELMIQLIEKFNKGLLDLQGNATKGATALIAAIK